MDATTEQIRSRNAIFHADGSPMSPEELPSRQVLAGASVGGPTLVRFRHEAAGTDQLSEVFAVPVRGDDGAIRAVISYFRDVTEEHRLIQRERVAARVGRVVGSSLELQATLDGIVRVAVPDLADWCYVDLLDEEGRTARAATAAVDMHIAELLLESAERWPTGSADVVASGEPVLISEVTDEDLIGTAHSPEHLELLRSIGYSSYLCVPVRSGDRTLGALTLVTAESRRTYDGNDLSLAQELAARAAAALDNAELYRHAQRTSALLDSLVDSAPIGLGFWDRDLRYVRVNDALARINELPPEEHVGKTFAEVVPHLAHVIEPIARRVLESKEPVVALEISAGSPSMPDEQASAA